ncbi:MAG: hypothetical protein WCA12_17405, partial [Burkholderiales bacterium]
MQLQRLADELALASSMAMELLDPRSSNTPLGISGQVIVASLLRVLKSPPQSPVANAFCERLIGTIRRECRDWLIPISASHLRL